MTAINIINISELSGVGALFDAYRVFYGQESNVESSRSFLKERMEKNEIIVFLARDNAGKPIGFANIYPSFSSVSIAPIWILNDLYVAPDCRREGLASALISAVETNARQRGVIRLKLETAPDNLSAQAVYEKNGWERNSFLSFVKNV